MTFKPQQQPGFMAYIDKFGELDLPDLPEMLDIECGAEHPAFFCVELGQYLGKCAKAGKRATVRGYVDALYLSGGTYAFGGVKTNNFDDFIKRINSVRCDI